MTPRRDSDTSSASSGTPTGPPRSGTQVEASGPAHRRSDARRTHARIVRAASQMVLGRRQITMSALAREAGVSRPTLYDHFTSTQDVLEAAVARAVALGQQVVDDVDAETASPTEALARLLQNRWRALADHDELHRLATETLPPGRMHALHRAAEESLTALVERGREAGDFRTDLPTSWLVTVVYGLLHQAAQEVLAGRLTKDEAGDLLSRTVLSTLARRD